MAIFEKKGVVYYLSPVIRKNKEGRKEKHYHVLCARFTNQSGYHWLQLVGTSKEIERVADNVVVVEPSECSVFTKKTRFDCDRVYAISEQDMAGAVVKGEVSDAVFARIKMGVGNSEKIKGVYKKRMGILIE